MRIGVLALQGGYREHIAAVTHEGAQASPIREAAQLEGLDGLIVPGGESTTIALLADRTNLRSPIEGLIKEGMPVLGTCAGMIMLADRVVGGRDDRPPFGGIDMTVRRNAFGRQRESFELDVEIPVIGSDSFRGVFIRAPQVTEVSEDVSVLASIPQSDSAGTITAVRQRNLMATAFHPELAGDGRIHGYFLRMVKGEESQ